MAGFGATEFSPYSQWWGANNPVNGSGVQVNPVPDVPVDVKQLPPLGQGGSNVMQNRGKLADAMMFSKMFQNDPLMSAAAYLKGQGYGLGLGDKIMSGIKGLFGG